jgi:hypothetical protein
MQNRHVFWKIGAMLFCSTLSIAVLSPMPGKSFLAASMVKLSCILAALGLFQYAFGWPRLPILLWRIFAPLFLFGWVQLTAFYVGWLATRLATRTLTGWQQVETVAYLGLYALFGVIMTVPLVRLGEWNRLRFPRAPVPAN